eukprot:gb/GECG01003034.1/.p1 GENE.gb/GECG01003034.1/~~gb/GECG01003034.1/.p1  ORF type:complete len:255 (+),score=27.14 gb/GECG01003034.1/:1-765(+)
MSGSTEEITVERPLEKHDEIAILDFGSQYTHIIARRLRECSVFCEIHSCEISAQNLVRNRSIRGLILSGGPASVYDEDAPHVSRELWELAEERQWPILGICYGFQEMVHHSGGKVEYALEREYGLALVEQMSDAKSGQLFENIPSSVKVWMSHGDKIVKLPERTSVLAKTGTRSAGHPLASRSSLYSHFGLQKIHSLQLWLGRSKTGMESSFTRKCLTQSTEGSCSRIFVSTSATYIRTGLWSHLLMMPWRKSG